MGLDDEVRYLKGVGPARARRFAALSVHTVRDLLEHYPFRIEDYSDVIPISEALPGKDVTVAGKVLGVSRIHTTRGPAVRVCIGDGTGELFLVFYHMPYLLAAFKKGTAVMASGKVAWRRNAREIAHPLWRPLPRGLKVSRGPILTVYRSTEGLTSATIRQAVRAALEKYGPLLENVMPDSVREKYGLLPDVDALYQIHFPESAEAWNRARRTLAFREMLLFQMAVHLMKQAVSENGSGPRFSSFLRAREFLSKLPFPLTAAQMRVIGEITEDLASGRAMNRLLQGDVGSGKTVVAAYCLVAAVENGFQGAFLVPTEVLAQQHHRTLSSLAEHGIRVELLTGSTRQKDRLDLLNRLESGDLDIVVGTHALLEPGVRWRNLGLVVTDEQHRFGVRQRLAIQEKAWPDRHRSFPHVLVMTATPIPRSLALTMYGDLDISVIDELPPGRTPVRTVALSPGERYRAYEEVRRRAALGQQAYVVCPVIREGESGRTSVEETWRKLKDGPLRDLSVGLLHGEMAAPDKEAVMRRFARGEVQVLVSTTVIEVGVDVPAATVMVIEDADSFGLATLHQLRGRVGRGSQESVCFLIASPRSRSARERLEVVCTTYDGLKLAEMDLAERGPGEFFGLRQHGFPDVNWADLGIDVETIIAARQEARRLLEESAAGSGEVSRLVAEVWRRYGQIVTAGRSR